MATSAQIGRQLVEALELDLIGPGWDNVARHHEKRPQPPTHRRSRAARCAG